jgi:hypothetical protein
MLGAQDKSRPEAAFGGSCKPSYLDAAPIAAEAAMFAELAASVAAEAADIAAPVAALVSAGGGVTTVVAGAVAGGVVVVVVVSSFLLQAANETAAARVTISNAVFIFLLDLVGSDNHRQLWEPSSSKSPIVFKPWKAGSISSA